MRFFRCQICAHAVHFEHAACPTCGHALGFIPGLQAISTLQERGPGQWRALAAGEGRPLYRKCLHARSEAACNWMVPLDDPEPLCASCRLSRTIPDISHPRLRQQWARVEFAKRRLWYGLVQLRLPILTRDDDPAQGLCFDFLADTPAAYATTGHESGVIIINIVEADDAQREREHEKIRLGEPYRTVLDQLRHEIGHYYWDRLILDPAQLVEFRSVFGNEEAGYLDAQSSYHQHGPPPDWARRFISPYASMHPWEDWAECFAHYLHMVDVIETSAQLGLLVRATGANGEEARVRLTALEDTTFDDALRSWIPLTFAINSLHRSMGLSDWYPDALPAEVAAKVRFVHRMIAGAAARGAAGERAGSARPGSSPPR